MRWKQWDRETHTPSSHASYLCKHSGMVDRLSGQQAHVRTAVTKSSAEPFLPVHTWHEASLVPPHLNTPVYKSEDIGGGYGWVTGWAIGWANTGKVEFSRSVHNYAWYRQLAISQVMKKQRHNTQCKCLFMYMNEYVPLCEHVVQFFCMVSIAVDPIREKHVIRCMLPMGWEVRDVREDRGKWGEIWAGEWGEEK